MGFAMPSQSDLAPSSFVEKPGWYHVAVTDSDANPTKKDGGMMDAIKVEFGIFTGTEPSQKKRQFTGYFNNPNLSHKDGGAFCWSAQVRLAMCLNVPATRKDGSEIPFAKVPAGEEVDINWDKYDLRGRQLVVKVVAQKDRDGFQIDGKHIYHPADEEVKDIPKDAAALKLAGIKASTGNTNGGASNQQKPTNGNGNVASGNAAQQPPKTTTGPDLDDIDF